MNKINQARASRIWLSLGATAIVGIALGCGQVGGAGQGSGVDETGVFVSINGIVPTDTAVSGKDTSDVDAFQTADCDPTTPVLDVEPFGKHSAKVAITATLMPGVTASPGPAPSSITFTHYQVDYTASPTNSVSAPALTSQPFNRTFLVNTDGSSLEETLEFVPIQTKVEYVSGGGSPTPAIYTAKYTITGTTEFNQPVVLIGSTDFNIGDFNNCP